jgi:hypothetical protein
VRSGRKRIKELDAAMRKMQKEMEEGGSEVEKLKV